MISHIDTAGVNLELSEDIKKYIIRKVGRLDRYVSREDRKHMSATVTLRETNNRLGNKYECEATLRTPKLTVQAKESTLNMFAVVDIVEVKLRNQLGNYREDHSSKRSGLLKRLKKRFS